MVQAEIRKKIYQVEPKYQFLVRALSGPWWNFYFYFGPGQAEIAAMWAWLSLKNRPSNLHRNQMQDLMKNPKIFHQKPEYWMKNISKLDFFKTIWVFFLKLDFIYNLLFKRLLGKKQLHKRCNSHKFYYRRGLLENF